MTLPGGAHEDNPLTKTDAQLVAPQTATDDDMLESLYDELLWSFEAVLRDNITCLNLLAK